MKKLSSELVEDVKRKAPLTDTEKLAIESASEMYEEILGKYNQEGVLQDSSAFLKDRQREYNRLVEAYPNAKPELREAFKLPQKMYGGGSVRMTRNY